MPATLEATEPAIRRLYFRGPCEVRAEGDESPKIVGLGAVYYDGTPRTEYEIWPGVVERIRPGAFAKSIRDDDVRGLWNHNSDLVLGRRSPDSGRQSRNTMRLWESDDGLHYEVTPPDSGIGRTAVESIQRGDVDGSSIGFFVTGYQWSDGEQDGPEVRELTEFELLDVSPVTYPAFNATTVGIRAIGEATEARESYTRWLTDRRAAVEMEREATQRLYTARARLAVIT